MAIQILGPDVAAKIAAGEVIEQPASIVKELVENSLDAGANTIQVVVKNGGLSFIQVVDNGIGIPPDEVELAFMRHATSKLRMIGDLEKIKTLGFRGEALPSIASVARVTLLTRVASEEAGVFVETRKDGAFHKQYHAATVGTIVTVQHLFENVPARRKFLKPAKTEAGRIHVLLSRLALAYPEVRFVFTLDERTVLTSPGTGSLRDAFAAVYSIEEAQRMLFVDSENDATLNVGVYGCISPINLSRGNGTAITIIINRRWVQSRALTFAVREAYQGLLPVRRYPVAVLILSVPSEDIDVNVHPAKTEIRLRQERGVFGVLQRTVRASLLSQSPVSSGLGTLGSSSGDNNEIFGQLVVPFAKSGRALQLTPSVDQGVDAPPRTSIPFRPTLPLLRVLAQVQTTYIVAEGPDGLYLIDQHAAHERVIYEQLIGVVDSPFDQRQGLLEPKLVELDPEEEALLEDVIAVLEKSGFLIEHFGAGNYLIRAIPAVLKDSDPSNALRDVLSQVSEDRVLGNRSEQVNASVACHGSVRAGQTLQIAEMRELVQRLERVEKPQTCPHGRPTMIHMSVDYIERQFGRR
jgi:DNA mismatch repair protein MutL